MNGYECNGTDIFMKYFHEVRNGMFYSHRMKIAVPSHELKAFIICFI